MPDLIIIGDHTHAMHPDIHAGMKGLIPRDLITHPVGYSANIPPSTIKPFSRDIIIQMIAEQEAAKSRNSDILLRGDGGNEIPALDQNGQGYCWAYGPTGALQGARARMNLPYKKLSGHAVAWKIKHGRDEGGWGALALDYIIEHGIPDTDHWKEKSMSASNDTAATWENAKLYVPDMTVIDLASSVYERRMAFDVRLTFHLMGGFTANDYPWWSHCITGCDAVNGNTKRMETRMESGKLATPEEFEIVWGINDPVTGGLAVRDRNQWGEGYGDRGFLVITGSKAEAGNSVGILTASAT